MRIKKMLTKGIAMTLSVCVMAGGIPVYAAENEEIVVEEQAQEFAEDEIALDGDSGQENVLIEDSSDDVVAVSETAADVPTVAAVQNGVITQVSLGQIHSAALDKNGDLWTWGYNGEGCLGDGSHVRRRTPVKILEDVKEISLGTGWSAAIKKDGSLWTWGWNIFGALGNGNREDTDKPTKIMEDVIQISLGYRHSAAIKKDGSLWVWGGESRGDLGIEGIKNSSIPIKIMEDVAQVSVGYHRSAAVKKDGSLWVWGRDIGLNKSETFYTPVKIMDDVVTACVNDCYAAIKTDGSLWMWGYNFDGQLGNGKRSDSLSSKPLKIMEDVSMIDLGDYHSAAIKTDGSLWMWGSNENGKLGNGSVEDSYVPIKIMENVTKVSLGSYHSAAIKEDGSLWMWGKNDYGQIGDDTQKDKLTPTQIFKGDPNWTDTDPTPTPSKTPNSYGVENWHRDRDEIVCDEMNEYAEAIENYYTKVKGGFEQDSKDLKNQKDKFKELREFDETAVDRKTNQLITMDSFSKVPDEATNDAYEVLYDFLEKCVEVGTSEKIIDIDTSDTNIEINAKMVNQIFDIVLETSEDIKGTGSNGYTVELVKAGALGAIGNITITKRGGKKSETYHGTFCSSGKVVSAAMTKFIDDMSEEAKKLYKEAAISLWHDFIDISQLGSVTESMLKSYLQDKAEYLIQKGYGKLLNIFLDMKKGLDIVNSFVSAKTPEDALKLLNDGNAKDIYNAIKGLKHTDDKVVDEAVKTALGEVESSRKSLESALFDYIYNDDTWDDLNFFDKTYYWCKSIFQCPVDVEVYSESGDLIGRATDESVSFDDGIYMELHGDVKTVYIPEGMKVNYKITGTNYGTMNYVLEEYKEGIPVGRLNFYDIPLSKGCEYNQSVQQSDISGNIDDIPLVQDDGKTINADEYISASDKNANVEITGKVDGNGVILGAGKYARGDSVELTAIADGDSVFKGWYEDGVLMEYASTYRFTAVDDAVVTACFEEKPNQSIEYSVQVSDKYKENANVKLKESSQETADIVISLYSSDSTENFDVTIEKYDSNGKSISKEKTLAVCDGGFHYVISDVKLKDWTKLELSDSSGDIIAEVWKGSQTSKQTITIRLSANKYVYNGKAKKPSVKVFDGDGKKISSKYYTVSYAKGRKKVGKYKVTVKLKKKYEGTITEYFTIVPKGTSIKKLSAKTNGFKASWKKQTAQTSGYELQYSMNSKFEDGVIKAVSGNKKTSMSISELKEAGKYYVRVRTYKTVKTGGESSKLYSSWSKSKSVKVKKVISDLISDNGQNNI